MSVVSISTPKALLERIDEFADEHGYSGRSEVVREGIHTLLEEFQGRNIDGQKHACTGGTRRLPQGLKLIAVMHKIRSRTLFPLSNTYRGVCQNDTR